MAVIVEEVDGVDRAEDLRALRIAWGTENGWQLDADFNRRFTAWLEAENQSRRFFVAREQARPIGMVNLLVFDRMPAIGRPDGGWGYLCNMFVVPESRNHGIGAELLGTLLESAERIGLERVVLNPSDRSIPFYERHGFGRGHRLLVRS